MDAGLERARRSARVTTTRGFLLGKFMPPHAGHVSLCRAAQGMVDELTILVCSLPDDSIDGETRVGWMRELFPKARVEWLSREVPQAPEDSPDFWPIWRALVREYHPEPIDYVFAGELYGERLAKELGATFVPFLREDSGLFADLSATKVRGDPAAQWPHLPTPVRKDWVKVVALHGVESVGKSTLARQLADRLSTQWVSEYGRAHCEVHGTDLGQSGLQMIAAAHQAQIEAAKEWSGPVLITDTDWVMTAAWSEMMLGEPLGGPAYPLADLYLHLPPDRPWVDDGTRIYGEDDERLRFDRICRAELARRGCRVVTLDAAFAQRLNQALDAIAQV